MSEVNISITAGPCFSILQYWQLDHPSAALRRILKTMNVIFQPIIDYFFAFVSLSLTKSFYI